MSKNFVHSSALAIVVALLSACSTVPTPPPQPDMTDLVPVNTTMPPQLAHEHELRQADALGAVKINDEERRDAW